MEPNALLEPALDVGTIRACESDFLDGFVDLDFLFFGAEVETHEILRIGCRRRLREVDNVNRSLALVHEFLYFRRNFCRAVAEVERYRALRRADGYGLAARVLCHVAFEKFGGADGRAHQEESRLRERK